MVHGHAGRNGFLHRLPRAAERRPALASDTAAAQARPTAIKPWNGPTRGFSFDREVQPVLDRRCVGCHNGQPYRDGDRMVATPDLRAKQLHPDFPGPYSPAYMVLQKYVRRAGYESDIHMHVPSEYEADTSALVQMLKKGHHNVQLTRDDWERLYTWIDFNVPYPANWHESHVPPSPELVERRVKHQKLFAGIDDKDEEPLPLPPVAAFEPPAAAHASAAKPLRVSGWPLDGRRGPQAPAGRGGRRAAQGTDPGRRRQDELRGHSRRPLRDGQPRGAANESPETVVAIARPFYLGATEVTNAQYAAFDPQHDSGYIEGRDKDRTTRGTPINAPDQPVVASRGTRPWPSAVGSRSKPVAVRPCPARPNGNGPAAPAGHDLLLRRLRRGITTAS